MSIFLSGQLTVYFESPFWVGVFERHEEGKLQVSKIVFGPEPKDYEVYAFVQSNYGRLEFSRPVADERTKKKRVNPKRLQREISKALQSNGVRTKAQEAVQKQLEEKKIIRKSLAKERREANSRQAFLQKQQKKKEKKRGH